MKNYRIKNYNGNLLESLTKFAKSHNGMRIIEAVEDEDELKVKAEIEEGCGKIDEAFAENKVYVIQYAGDSDSKEPLAIGSSLQKARELAKEWHAEYDDGPNDPYASELKIVEMTLDEIYGSMDYASFKNEKA